MRFHQLYDIPVVHPYRGSKSPHRQEVPAVERCLAFIAYCFHVLKLQATTINNYLAGVSYALRCQGEDVNFLNAAAIQMARSGVALLSRGKRAASETGCLPFTFEMVLRYKEIYSISIARCQGIFTALMVAFTLLLRISEYAMTSSDHYLRGGDVLFVLQSGLTLPASQVTKSQSSVVTAVIFVIRSAKNDQLGEAHRLCFPKRRQHDSLPCICSLVWDWAMRALPNDSAPFFSYRGQWTLSRRDIDAAVKQVAKSYKLDTRRYTPHSLRYGGASALAARGVPDSHIQIMGRWKSLAFLQYLKLSRQVMERSLNILTDPSAFTVADVRRLTSATRLT